MADNENPGATRDNAPGPCSTHFSATAQPPGADSVGAPIGQAYSNIPQELREYHQWVLFDKSNKVPFNPITGAKASVTNANDWSDYTTAANVASNNPGFGIGFVFTENDPYCFIDLDDPKGDAHKVEQQKLIVEEFNSYTELSPSGTGVHIIVKANLPHGRRRDKVELYPHERYATMTGNVVHNVGIEERQELASLLFNEMGGEKANAAGIQPDREASQSDTDIVAQLCSDPARNALYHGDLSSHRGDHSAGDMELCNVLARLSGNRAQVERIWLASPVGDRQKTQSRKDYRQRTIEAAFNELPLDQAASGFTVNGNKFFPETANEPQVLDVSMWAGVAPPVLQYAISGFVLAGQLTFFTGAGGSGKSLLSQLMCSTVALGQPCLGQATTRGVSLYVTCEDDTGELQRRQLTIAASLGVNLSAFKGQMGIVSLAGAIDNELATFDRNGKMTVAPGYHWLERNIKTMGASYVVLDNVAHFYSGDENNRHQVASFQNLLNGLAAETGAAIVLIGHPNKSGDGYSGSTAWENQVRSRLFLAVPTLSDGLIPDRDARILTRAKSNYGRAGDNITFRWHSGSFVRDQDLEPDVAKEIAKKVQDNGDNEVFLNCLRERLNQKRAVSELHCRTFAPTIFAKMAISNSIGKPRLEEAMERLFKLKAIERGLLWRDAEQGKDRSGLRLVSADPPADHPLTLSPTHR